MENEKNLNLLSRINPIISGTQRIITNEEVEDKLKGYKQVELDQWFNISKGMFVKYIEKGIGPELQRFRSGGYVKNRGTSVDNNRRFLYIVSLLHKSKGKRVFLDETSKIWIRHEDYNRLTNTNSNNKISLLLPSSSSDLSLSSTPDLSRTFESCISTPMLESKDITIEGEVKELRTTVKLHENYMKKQNDRIMLIKRDIITLANYSREIKTELLKTENVVRNIAIIIEQNGLSLSLHK